MRTFSAKSVVVVAALAGASVSGWAKVSTQQGGQQDMLVAQAQTGMQPAAFYVTPVALGQPRAERVANATAAQEPAPAQEKANMGMMLLVGLGMVGTLVVKNNRS